MLRVYRDEFTQLPGQLMRFNKTVSLVGGGEEEEEDEEQKEK